MLVKLFDVLPDWAKSKIFIRICYTVGSLFAAKTIDFLGQPAIQVVLQKVFMDPRLTPGAEVYLNTAIVALLMTAGEFVISHIHENHVKPIVAANPPEGEETK